MAAIRTFTVLIQQEQDSNEVTDAEATQALRRELQEAYDGGNPDFGDGNFLIIGVEDGDERFWREWHRRRREQLPNWERDEFQFPRLLAEIVATIDLTRDDFAAIAEGMDLHSSDVEELFDRAQAAWEEVKEETTR